MTQTLIPFRETKPRRDHGLHEGPYYGAALRKIVNVPEPEPSIVERASDYYSTHRWPSVVLLVLGCGLIGAAIVAGTWSLL